MDVSNLAAYASIASSAMAKQEMSVALTRQQHQADQAVVQLVSQTTEQLQASAPNPSERILDIEV